MIFLCNSYYNFFKITEGLEIQVVLENQLVDARVKSSKIFGITEKQVNFELN
jgi:hypothetical protein